MLTLSRQQVREVDRLAIEQVGIPGIVLMENAGRHAAEVVLDLLELELHLVPLDAYVAIYCGGGNNGGDGYVIARHLANSAVNVVVYATKDLASAYGDAAVNYAIAAQMGLVEPAYTPEQLTGPNGQKAPHVVVDALLGTGFTAAGGVRDDMAAAIEHCNGLRAKGARLVAVDVPSGLDCDLGQPAAATIEADVTVTFVAAKTGFTHDAAAKHLGRLVVVEIGAPPHLIDQVLRSEPAG